MMRRLDAILAEVTSSREKLAAAAIQSASRDEDSTRPTGEEDSIDRVHPREQGGTPRMERDVIKAPSRSRDGWTIRKPTKRTGAEAPASDLGGIRQTETETALKFGEPSPARGRPILRIISRCERIASKAESPTPAMRSHLRIVGSSDHARSFSGVGT